MNHNVITMIIRIVHELACKSDKLIQFNAN